MANLEKSEKEDLFLIKLRKDLDESFEKQKLEYLEERKKLVELFNINYRPGEKCTFNIYSDKERAPSKAVEAAVEWFVDIYLEKKFNVVITPKESNYSLNFISGLDIEISSPPLSFPLPN